MISVDAGTHDETVVSVHSLEGVRRVNPPEWAGKVVSIANFKDDLYVACEGGVFRIDGMELVPLRFAPA